MSVRLNQLSDDLRETRRLLSKVIARLEPDNKVRGIDDGEGDQRLGELQAGQILISRERVDPGKVKSLLVPALNWFLKKLGEKGADELINLLVKLIEKLFPS